ncbi:MAG: helix-turn-helix transcriptional regulator [Acidimicrobiales bacterium]
MTMADQIGRGVALLGAGDPEGWEATRGLSWRAGSAKDRLALTTGAIQLAGHAVHLGYHHRARTLLAQARGAVAEVRSPLGLADALRMGEILLAWVTGDWSALERLIYEQLVTPGGFAPAVAAARAASGHVSLAQGDLDHADQHFHLLLEVASRASVVPALAAGAAGLARISLHQGNLAAALDHAHYGVGLIAAGDRWPWGTRVVPTAVEAMLAAGCPREARELTRRFCQGLAGRDAPRARAALHVCRGLLDESSSPSEAAAHYRSASRGFAALPEPYEAALADGSAGMCLIAAGDKGASESLLGALRCFRRLGASADAERTRVLIDRHGLPAPKGLRGSPERPWPGHLTPRQREVARLAARGMTNRAIAGQLRISTRTVEHHLADALAKLGLRSRTLLAAQWHEVATPLTVERAHCRGH